MYVHQITTVMPAGVTCVMNNVTNLPKIIVLKAVYIALFKLTAVRETVSDRGI